MVRLLHFADLHLDRAFSGYSFAGCSGARRRQFLRQALEWVVDIAALRRPDLVTVGGDLFENEHVTSDTMAFVMRQLERAACPVLVVSGNHDFSRDSSPYRTLPWPANVTLAVEPRWTRHEVGGAVVWAIGHNGPLLGPQVLDTVRPTRDDPRTQLMLVHAIDLETAPAEPGRLGLRSDAVRALGFDHALVGHIHSGHVGPVISTPGAMVPLHPGEVEGNHGAVWLQSDGRDVRVEALPLDLATYSTVSLDVGGVADSSALEDACRQALKESSTGSQMITVRLFGRRPASLRIDVDGLTAALPGIALGLRVVDATDRALDLAELGREPNARGAALSRLLDDGSEGSLLAAHQLAEAFERDLVVPV